MKVFPNVFFSLIKFAVSKTHQFLLSFRSQSDPDLGIGRGFREDFGFVQEHPTTTGYNVVLPTKSPFSVARFSDSARHLVDGIRLQAQGFAGEPVEVLLVDANRRRLWRLCDNTALPISDLGTRRVQLMMNPSFLLADPPPLSALEQKAERNQIAWCGAKSSRDTHAFGFTPETLGLEDLWQALAHLTACIDDDVEADWERIATMPFLAPAQSCVENSPALQGISGARSRRSKNSPRFLNTAISEILSDPQDCGTVAGDPERMAQALLAQRDASRVPWIFNSLLNEIDYRVGRTEPHSFPPEVHLSITGVCNIECRFCTYTHDIARFQSVNMDQIAQLDFLRNVQTLRLQSGLGEPTMNPHLPEIIEHLATNFPHLGINFFTNAIALNRPGFINALVGNVRWVNASLNASTRESWRELCKVDQFERVCENLIELHRVKRSSGSLWPLVFGSMVLTKANLAELPQMPSLCRELGIDRFTAFPYFGLGYKGSAFGPEMTLEACRKQYEDLYWETVLEAEKHSISLEIPLAGVQKKTRFGLEVRPLHDFARIESNQWPLGRFLTTLKFEKPVGEYCHFLWRSAAIANTYEIHNRNETHYLYPCLGPLSSLDLSLVAPFRFSEASNFINLWRNPVFTHLRKAQHRPGMCPVCDVCRRKDTRDPKNAALLERLVGEFSAEHCGYDGPTPPRVAIGVVEDSTKMKGI